METETTTNPNQGRALEPSLDPATLVARYYSGLRRFALSLTGCEADASDLTQHTFYVWATKGHQLRDLSKVRAWLFTTLHCAFLQIRRHQRRFPHHELSEVDAELPTVSAERVSRLDAAELWAALERMDERFQKPVALFYLESLSYQEIASALEVPLGTVKSRIARGIVQLQRHLSDQGSDRHLHNQLQETT